MNWIFKKRICSLLKYIKPHWLKFVFVLAASLICAILSMALPLGFGNIIDLVGSNSFRKILSTILIIVMAILIRSFITLASSYVYSCMNNNILANIRRDMFKHMLNLPISYFNEVKSGAIISRFLNDVNAIQNITTNALLSIITDVLTIIVILVTMIINNWKLGITSLGTLILYFLVLTMNPSLKKLAEKIQNIMSDITATIQESIAGIKTIKSFASENRHYILYKEQLEYWLKTVSNLVLKSTIARESAGLITNLGPIAVLSFGLIMVSKGALTIGSVVTFYALLNQLYAPFRRLVQLNINFQTGIVSFNRVFDFLEIKQEKSEITSNTNLVQIKGEIKFDNIYFSYKTGEQLFKGLNFYIAPGQIAGLVGASGSGKSTLIDLLLGFYNLEKGGIYIDENNIDSYDISDLRRIIGVVSQDIFLFNNSILENIRFGQPNASDQEVINAAKASNAHEFICQLPDNYNTVIGDRGIKLSVGQRQRISIARTILKNPKILILDEATSSLDAYSQMLVHSALNDLMKGRSCIIIAHRLSTVKDCDIIYVLHEGRISEYGTHKELIENKGVYWKLYIEEFGETKAG